jgi:hypothetical protein
MRRPDETRDICACEVRGHHEAAGGCAVVKAHMNEAAKAAPSKTANASSRPTAIITGAAIVGIGRTVHSIDINNRSKPGHIHRSR